MTQRILQTSLADEAATAALAATIAPILLPGDTLLLEGDIGAGKSAFARALIRARLGRMEDVPSPTFTLVQTYEDADGDLWHCDLYRLTHPDEALELGLDTAFETAICLVEWPDRLGAATPQNALRLAFVANQDNHNVTITGSAAWANRVRVLHG
ncbi:tRNA (adenosine(37)-N6)-threonylcarbamoyltransferase complex ATPase subunit type 1 TsaE [Loktanella sp. Alg231-35]|uniref:tRNA (adenosine(37)-N6)-threonylcarbamoyltransferase complex ATPase subunit type 1 TsaE n=1 Tax=Loktanella sp. Alg231-35 TaxID=1922220 RepID=UPI000D5578FA|nr:tRNA (adenosine(37)-N6)-threonylcarbamoyltransferase complex ATPase subunit type 1 TsaE [Loktanella sp. Alg231-35]